MVRLGKHALENSQRPATQEQSEPQLPTSQLNDVSRSRPPFIQSLNLSNIHHSTPQTDNCSIDKLDTPEDNPNTPEATLSGASFASDMDHSFGNIDLSTLGEDSFEAFFEHFLDANFPTCLGEQSLGGYDKLF